MPLTFILLLVYASAIALGLIGVVKKVRIIKLVAIILFLIGVALTAVLFIAIKNM